MKNSIFKTGWFLLFAAGLLAVMSACKKDNTTSELRAVMNDFANSNQKAYIDPEQYSCFVIGEEMRVNNSDGTVLALARNDRQCTIDNVPVSDGSSLKAFYPKKLLTTLSQSENLSSGFSNLVVDFPRTQECRRDANGNQIIDNPMIAELSNFGSNNQTLHFRNLCALLKLTVCTRSSFDAIRVTMGNTVQLWGKGSISRGKVVMDGNSGSSTVILTIPGHTSSPTGEAFYIMIPEVELQNNDVVTVEFMNNNAPFKSYTLTISGTKKLAYNEIHTLGFFTFNAKVFSVAENRTVIFAPGNLQWSYTGGGIDSTKHSINGAGYNLGTWRFAPNQYDVIGANNTNAIGKPVEVHITQYYSVIRNTMFYNNYQGWIDLFAWGGSGYGDSRPYYYNRPNTNYYLEYNVNNLGAYDWGAFNTIYNPRTKANDPYGTWRVLTKGEWEYLLHFSGVTDGRNNSWCRFNTVAVTLPDNSVVDGLIIYPDNISTVDKPSFIPNVNDEHTSYTITFAQFESLEGMGCAFLPNAGFMNISDNQLVFQYPTNTHGHYWTSQARIPANGTIAYPQYLFINQGGGIPTMMEDGSQARGFFRSVRLARDVN